MDKKEAHVAVVKFRKHEMFPNHITSFVKLISNICFCFFKNCCLFLISSLLASLNLFKHWYNLIYVRVHKHVAQIHANIHHPCNLKSLVTAFHPQANKRLVKPFPFIQSDTAATLSFCIQPVFCVSCGQLFFVIFWTQLFFFLAVRGKRNLLFSLALFLCSHPKSQNT